MLATIAARIPWKKPCLRIGVVSTPAGLSWLQALPGVCDVVEVRIDRLLHAGLSRDEIGRAIESAAPPLLLTFRAATEGGAASGATDIERHELLTRWARPDDAIDFEHASLAAMLSHASGPCHNGAPLILSSHYFGRELTAAAIESQLALMRRIPARIYKIAALCTTESALDALEQAQRRQPGDVALMGTGALAAASRQGLPRAGARLVYGYLDSATAPGQPPASELTV